MRFSTDFASKNASKMLPFGRQDGAETVTFLRSVLGYVPSAVFVKQTRPAVSKLAQPQNQSEGLQLSMRLNKGLVLIY